MSNQIGGISFFAISGPPITNGVEIMLDSMNDKKDEVGGQCRKANGRRGEL